VLVKPLNASALMDGLSRALAGRRAPPAPVAAAPPPALEQLRPCRGARVLVVDDNEINQEIAAELLSDAGLVVDVAGDGAQAVAAAQARPYDLILMDMHMPVMDGPAAARALRALPAFTEIPIIAMTANVMQADRDVCRQAGMNDFLTKPVDPDDLYQLVARWIQAAEVRAPRLVAQESGFQALDVDTLSQVVEHLAHIPGLDADTGLRRTGRKQAVYVNLLRKFLRSQASAPADIRDALQAGEPETALRPAHSLKGVAGNLGATGVQAAAEALELSLRAGDDLGLIDASPLNAVCQTFWAELTRALAPLDADPDTAGPDQAQLDDVLKELAHQLTQGYPEAQDTLDAHRDLLQHAFGERFDRLSDQVRSFAFDAALNTVNALWAAARPDSASPAP
jgi:CheY-like chemotaxis protein/HPt (histidine-containing phosphotransfer) domain-containing protein